MNNEQQVNDIYADQNKRSFLEAHGFELQEDFKYAQGPNYHEDQSDVIDVADRYLTRGSERYEVLATYNKLNKDNDVDRLAEIDGQMKVLTQARKELIEKNLSNVPEKNNTRNLSHLPGKGFLKIDKVTDSGDNHYRLSGYHIIGKDRTPVTFYADKDALSGIKPEKLGEAVIIKPFFERNDKGTHLKSGVISDKDRNSIEYQVAKEKEAMKLPEISRGMER